MKGNKKRRCKKTSIKKNAGWKCEICNASGVFLNIDHIIPKSLGGTGSRKNLRALCRPCHDKETELLNSKLRDVVGLFRWARAVEAALTGKLSEDKALRQRESAMLSMGMPTKPELRTWEVCYPIDWNEGCI